MAISIALYGYDTDIGKLIIETLEEQDLDFADFFPLSPLNGEYDAVQIKRRNYFVEPINKFDFSRADVALFISTADESSQWVKKAQEAGCIVIDNSHLFSGDGHTVTIAPELNEYEIKDAVASRLVIPPLAPALQLALSLAPLDDEYGIERVSAVFLESVSEHGRLGTETLARETTLLLNGMSAEHDGFQAQLAFNLHTQIGDMEDNGNTHHENVIKNEVAKLMGRFEGGFDVTCIQVPVFYGHTLSVTVDVKRPIKDQDELEQVFSESEYVSLAEKGQMLTPVTDTVSSRDIIITRLRQQKPQSKTVSFVSLMDNSRRGEAITCVKLAQLLSKFLQK